MVPRSEKLELPGGVDVARVRAFVERALRGRAVEAAAVRVAAALAADTARYFWGRPCEVGVELGPDGDPSRVRISVSARLPIVPAEEGADLPDRPMDLVREETPRYGCVMSTRSERSTLWADLTL